MTGRVVVTGASGFLGRHLTALLGRQGIEFEPAARRELGQEDAWGSQFEGARAVVHLAAAAHETAQRYTRAGNYESLRRVNTLGSERVARAAARAGVPHFVFLSSIAVHGDETFGEPFKESSALAPSSLYGASKLEAERLLERLSGETGMLLTVLRPTLIYGPGNPGNFRRLLQIVASGWPLPFASVRNRRSFCYVGNAASAIVAVLRRPTAGTFVLCDERPVSTPELIRYLAAGLHTRARLVPLPPRLLTIAGRALGRGDLVRRLVGSLEADCSAIRDAFGWEAPFTPEQGLAETADWYRALHS